MVIETLTHRPEPLFIDGVWRVAGGDPIPVVNPSTDETFAHVDAATVADVVTAVSAATTAFDGWRETDGQTRAQYLEAISAGLKARRDALITLQMTNNGKPRPEAEIDLDDAIGCFEYYANHARKLDSAPPAEIMSDSGFLGLRRADPVGPVGMIVPWNFPLVTSAWKLAPALAAGCTAVLKVSEMTPLAELAYADIAVEIDLPPGVLNIVTGRAEAGRALSGDPRIRKLSFTGSNAVGTQVMAAAAERTVPVSLELGGKSPIIVTADADIGLAVDLIADGIFMNCGQLCSATSRLLVEDSIADKLLDALVAHTQSMKIGPPEAADMGPLTTQPQFERIREILARARDADARCLTGGAVLDGAGHFVAPTIYDHVAEDSFLWQDELFGPILSVRRFDTDGAAVRMANDTAFGLAATVVSGDIDRATAIAKRIEAGHIWVNVPQIILPDSLWGGFKASGIGRELGPPGLAAYQESKILTLPNSSS